MAREANVKAAAATVKRPTEEAKSDRFTNPWRLLTAINNQPTDQPITKINLFSVINLAANTDVKESGFNTKIVPPPVIKSRTKVTKLNKPSIFKYKDAKSAKVMRTLPIAFIKSPDSQKTEPWAANKRA